jgi:hypothetical protein
MMDQTPEIRVNKIRQRTDIRYLMDILPLVGRKKFSGSGLPKDGRIMLKDETAVIEAGDEIHRLSDPEIDSFTLHTVTIGAATGSAMKTDFSED